MSEHSITKTCRKCLAEKDLALFSILKKSKDGRQSVCKACATSVSKARYWERREEISEKAKKYRLENQEKIKEQKRQGYIKNKDKVLAYAAIYRSNNKEKISAFIAAHKKKKRAQDYAYNMKERIGCLIRATFRLRNHRKTSKTIDILGCSHEQFRQHIERQFLKGMNWENRNLWEIDHIRPIALAETEQDVIALNHFTNLRPIWARDNLVKSDKVEFLI